MKLKVVEWNIHGANDDEKYEMPQFVGEEILVQQKPDIFVLTEFIGNSTTDKTVERFKEKYKVYHTYHKGNSVLIGVRKSLRIISVNQIYLESADDAPNFLGLELLFDTPSGVKNVNIIGMRTRVLLKGTSEEKSSFKEKQLSMVNNYVENITEPFFLIGDLNVYGSWLNKKTQREVWNWAGGEISTFPRDYSTAWKYWWSSEIIMAPLDNFICKDVLIVDKKYDWNFRERYGNRNNYFVNSGELKLPVAKSYPDHAILVTTIEI